MTKFSRTWWGQEFIAAIEAITDAGRLSRGRSYASGSRIKSFTIVGNVVTAQVRGKVNPYFGVYKEPLYHTTIEMQTISKANWAKAIAHIAANAGFLSKLLLNEVPDDIDTAFTALGLHLLPHDRKDFKTDCSCPDYSNPCKHIAGVYYLVAAELDKDPFLLFELRGLSKAALQKELAKSPLGMALSQNLDTAPAAPQAVTSYYTRPERVTAPKTISLREFWHGPKRLPPLEPPTPANVPAILVKKQGDNPPFWHQQSSFIVTMADLYQRVKTKNRDLL
jgi:uncharacterized Zn finger protein